MAHRTIAASPLDGPQKFEATATAVAITPGFIVELLTAGTVQAHSTAGGTMACFLALEDENQGGAVATAYAVSAEINIGHFRPGQMAVVRIANGQTITIGEYLESAGTGYARQATAFATETQVTQPKSVHFVALEAVDMSGSTAVDPSDLCLVRVI